MEKKVETGSREVAGDGEQGDEIIEKKQDRRKRKEGKLGRKTREGESHP